MRAALAVVLALAISANVILVSAASSTAAVEYFKSAIANRVRVFQGYANSAKRGTHATLNAQEIHKYAVNFANTGSRVNHDCDTGAYICSPFGYFGKDACNGKQESEGGDCANFASQLILAGGHEKLTADPCRGDEFCGAEVAAPNLRECLVNSYGWASTGCKKDQKPPKNVKVGDLIFARKGSCDEEIAHTSIITKVDKTGVYISAHSADLLDSPIQRLYGGSYSYLEYVLF
eukprot:TRINITY_DN425_c0_g1_i1.p1 TRINITY_DN425_c0_g1~~TRINITY_DN425_c0_g1_i1.p1  ORF type:complete len:233 (+),score=61.82 TRINITY_DN425_c0_g1_i1:18-716(+)